VVEDDAIIALRNCEFLTKSGYHVPQMFASGEDLLDYIEESGPPDVILMDINLNGKIDGIETARQVLKQHNVPVIFFSSYSDENTISRANEISPYGYMVKPVDDGQLIETIEAALLETCL
jgi:DNA-binding NarL/FixJ family response regulator